MDRNEQDTQHSEHLRRAKLFLEQAGADLKEAQRHLRKGAALESGYLSLQAAMNAMSALAHAHGDYRLPSHSPARLAQHLCDGPLALAPDDEAGRTPWLDPAAALEAVQMRGPFDATRDPAAEKAEAAAHLEYAGALLKLVKKAL